MGYSIRLLLIALITLFIGLQYKLWFSDVGYFESVRLSREVDSQRQQLELLSRKNDILEKEVLAYKRGGDALESRARSDLGMVKQNEIFYIVNEL